MANISFACIIGQLYNAQATVDCQRYGEQDVLLDVGNSAN
jgi:hypothetical protein